MYVYVTVPTYSVRGQEVGAQAHGFMLVNLKRKQECMVQMIWLFLAIEGFVKLDQM